MSKTSTILQTKTIKRIEYSIMSFERMKELKVVDINKVSTQGKLKNNTNTIYDLSLGSTKFDKKCNTCHLNKDIDTGHYGLLNISTTPIINPLFIKYVVDILTLTCVKCGALLINRHLWKTIKRYPVKYRIGKCKPYLTKKKINNEKVCKNPNCKFNNKNIKYKQTDKNFIKKIDNDNETIYDNQTIYYRFLKLNEEEIEVLGIRPKSHPKNMILRGLLVPPTTIRPDTLQVNDGKYKTQTEDNISKLIKDIVQSKIQLDVSINKPLAMEKKDRISDEATKIQLYETLSIIIKNLFTNKNKSIKILNKGTRKKLSSYIEQMSKKTGLIRGNCMGKRKNFAGRSPLSGGKSFHVYEYGIPLIIAMTMVKSVYTNRYNIDFIKKCVANGNKKYPGAIKIIKKKSGKVYHLIADNNKINLNIAKNIKYGDIVFRHIIDGDWVLANRQPSLHKLSFMAHKAIILKDNMYSFRIHVMATTPYNADFDGDEMNLHGINTMASMIECKELASVKKNLLDMNGSRLTIGPIQDNILGLYIITKHPNDIIDKHSYMNIVIAGKYINYKYVTTLKQYKYIDLLNSIFPQKFNFKYKNCTITMGKWKQGMINKNIIGKIIKLIIHDFGSTVAVNFEFALQNITDEFLMYHGVTLSINDFVIPANIKKKINKNMKNLINNTDTIIKKYNLRMNTSDIDITNYENEISNSIDETYKTNNDIITQYIEDPNVKNNFVNEYKSGAKAKLNNIHQLLGGVGQQRVKGKRIQNEYNKRAFPHYPKYSENIKSRGFIFNSFSVGLDNIEYFTLSQVGRNGITDTALQTADTGYSNNQSVKSLESDVVSYDTFIRNNNKQIICFTFGHDGFNTQYRFDYNLLKIKNISKSDFDEIYV